MSGKEDTKCSIILLLDTLIFLKMKYGGGQTNSKTFEVIARKLREIEVAFEENNKEKKSPESIEIAGVNQCYNCKHCSKDVKAYKTVGGICLCPKCAKESGYEQTETL